MNPHEHPSSKKEPVPPCCATTSNRKSPWWRKPFFWAVSAAMVLYVVSGLCPCFDAYRRVFRDYLRLMAVPMALGFLIGGLIDYYIPREYVSKLLAQNSKRTVFYAAGLGFLMSACSHGIIALSMELHKKGASGPAVVSFLLASPWANLPLTVLLIGFFGWKGFVIILGALWVAISTGLLFQRLDHKGWIEKNHHTAAVDSKFSIRADFGRRWRAYRFSFTGLARDLRGVASGVVGLADMVLTWILVGMILASLFGAFLPGHIFHRFFGPSVLGLLVTLAAAAVMEVCSEGTSPLAFEIYKQTGAFGNAFAFLMGGVVTDYTEVGLVWSNLGRKTALWMLAITLPQVFLMGLIFNYVF